MVIQYTNKLTYLLTYLHVKPTKFRDRTDNVHSALEQFDSK